MIKHLTFAALLVSLLFAASCGSDQKPKNAKSTKAPEIKKGVTPVADPELVVLDTEFGQIKIETYSNIAPKHVARFKELVKEGFYNGMQWHRVSAQVIQAGNAATKKPDWKPGGPEVGSDKPDVEAEFSDIPYVPGTVGAARGPDPNSFNSQFFIAYTNVPQWTGQYTVFGKVVDGMNTVVTLSGVPKDGQRPDPPVFIKSATIQPK